MMMMVMMTGMTLTIMLYSYSADEKADNNDDDYVLGSGKYKLQ